MSDLKVLAYHISRNGEIASIELEQPNKQLVITRTYQSHNKYTYIAEDNDHNEIDITDIVSEEIKQIFSTVYHEQYQLKNL